MSYWTLKEAGDAFLMLWPDAGGGVLGRLEALGDSITGTALHRGALWGGRLAHLLLFCSGRLTTRGGSAKKKMQLITKTVNCKSQWPF